MTAEVREATRKEIEILDNIKKQWRIGMHYSTRSDLVERSGLPYQLVQTDRDDLGNFIWHGYRYYWRSISWGKGALYINETEAGKRLYASMGEALAALRKVLTDYLNNN